MKNGSRGGGLYFGNIYQWTTAESHLKMWFKHKAAKLFPIWYMVGLFAPFVIMYLAAKVILSGDMRPAIHTCSIKAFNKHSLVTSASFKGVHLLSPSPAIFKRQLSSVTTYLMFHYSVPHTKMCCDWLLKKRLIWSQNANRPVEALSQRAGSWTMWDVVRTDLFLVK